MPKSGLTAGMSETNILELEVAIGLDGNEYVPLVQGTGVNAATKRARTGLIASLGFATALPSTISWVIDGGGGNIAAQIWGTITVGFNANIVGVTMESDQTGTIIVDIRKCTYAQYNPPTTPSGANAITGSSVPTITAAKKYQDTNLAGWDTVLSEGDILQFYVPSTAVSITQVTLNLNLNRVVS